MHTVTPSAFWATNGGMLPLPPTPAPMIKTLAPSYLHAAIKPLFTKLVGAETLYSMLMVLPVSAISASATCLILSIIAAPAFVGMLLSASRASSLASPGSDIDESIISGISVGTWMAEMWSPGCAKNRAFFIAAEEPSMSLTLMPTIILVARMNREANMAAVRAGVGQGSGRRARAGGLGEAT
eukprot:CAMPEP_0203975780 /NCGR_PEP_ID=MMETSP0359-20131031/100784_1 /ASSEMBLY_ACC=CAM_ASM_000338 /TAXON_ID=268821 /ORGANISM="Scrippsiella Hangoei, Strain SHTV-5" /LENGTH=182 /DNA_ID=CAMNT_0050913983 /DNA_START=951 /DNA_END=1499 /DNA_ORIENTATION=+